MLSCNFVSATLFPQKASHMWVVGCEMLTNFPNFIPHKFPSATGFSHAGCGIRDANFPMFLSHTFPSITLPSQSFQSSYLCDLLHDLQSTLYVGSHIFLWICYRPRNFHCKYLLEHEIFVFGLIPQYSFSANLLWRENLCAPLIDERNDQSIMQSLRFIS